MGFIADLFGFGKQPKIDIPAPPPPPPTPEPVKQASERTRRSRSDLRRQAALMGARATNPTGSLGLPGAAPTNQKRLLGQ